MAVHGVSRSTADLDLLTLARECLDPQMWEPLRASAIDVQVRQGGIDDPLAGVVRFAHAAEHPVDLVVGKSRWQDAIIAGARLAQIEDARVPVASAPGLILLKLYAGGPQDAWDVVQLLSGPDPAALIAEVEAAIDALPAGCRELWERVRTTQIG